MMLMEKSEEMREAGEALLKLSADEEVREIVEAHERSERAFQTALHGAEMRGEMKGEQRGRDEERAKIEAEKLEFARNMIADGLPLSTVAKCTGLSVEVLEQLSI